LVWRDWGKKKTFTSVTVSVGFPAEQVPFVSIDYLKLKHYSSVPDSLSSLIKETMNLQVGL
jgi:hypothetical protein